MPETIDNNNGGAGGNGGGENETITIKKVELDKVNSDLENYKSMGLKHKEDAERWRTHEKTLADKAAADKVVAEKAEADRIKNQNGQGNQFDELKVSEVAKKTLRDANQRVAQSSFFKGVSDDERTAILAELHLTGIELTVEEYY